ncbi:MAG TPA: hypothetical protein VLS45_03000, partial [Methylomicrobium sp.]|nr:hypothetical protein [Methylomicrobium sp.]
MSLSGSRFNKSSRTRYKKAKAMAYSLKRYKELLYAAEVHGSDENYAIVAAGHAAGDAIEFGGNDRVIMVGDVPLDYNAMAILRRSL